MPITNAKEFTKPYIRCPHCDTDLTKRNAVRGTRWHFPWEPTTTLTTLGSLQQICGNVYFQGNRWDYHSGHPLCCTKCGADVFPLTYDCAHR